MLFFSSVRSFELFNTQKFYQIDIDILKSLGYTVILSNKISDALKFWTYDIIFAYFFRYSFFVGLLARILGKKVFITGGIDALDKSYATKKNYIIQKYFFLLCYLVSTKSIIVSRSDLDNIYKLLPKKKNWSKILISEHTIDISKYNVNIFQKEKIFTTIGWLGNEGAVKRKGIDTSVKIFKYLKKEPRFNDYKLIIIGRFGDGVEYLKRIIDDLGMKKDVILAGEISEEAKIELLKRSEYYLQPSEFEGFGLAALEAWAAGCILIHSGKGGLNNKVYEGRSMLFDVDQSFDRSLQGLIDKIKHFEKSSSLAQHDLEYYDNERRREDLKRVLNTI